MFGRSARLALNHLLIETSQISCENVFASTQRIPMPRKMYPEQTLKKNTKMYVLRMPQIYRNLIFMQLNRVTMLNISSSKATWKIGWGSKKA